MTQLQKDAGFWLMQSNNCTKLVLLIMIQWDSLNIKMERWQISGQSTSTDMAIRQQTVTLEANGTVNGAPLILPVDLIFSVVPPGMPDTEIQFSEQELSRWVAWAWAGLQ